MVSGASFLTLVQGLNEAVLLVGSRRQDRAYASATKCYSSGTEHGTAYAVVLRLLVARLHLSGDNSRARYIKGP